MKLCPTEVQPKSSVGFCLSVHYFYVLSSFAIISRRKREPVTLLLLSFGCLVTSSGLVYSL